MKTRTLIFSLFLILMVYEACFVVSNIHNNLSRILLFSLLQACSVMKFTNAICVTYNESLAKVPMCRIRAVSRYKNTFNYIVTFLHTIQRIRSRFQLYKRENGYKPFLYDFTLDNCQFLRKPTNILAILLRNQFKNFSNFFDQKCPVSVSVRMCS